jgi:hypothetical protein
MRIMAGTAPEPVPCRALATAFCQLFDVAIRLEAVLIHRHKNSGEICPNVPGAVIFKLLPHSHNARLAREMALRADSIPELWLKLCRIHHLSLAFDVQSTGTVAPLTRDAPLIENGIGIRVHSAFAPTRLARMAEEA